VPGVLLDLSGTTQALAATDELGDYRFSGVPTGGDYLVVVSKADIALSTGWINISDVIRVQQHFLGAPNPLLEGCALTAADVDESEAVDTVDALAILQFLKSNLEPLPPANHTGQWRFIPAQRTYSGLDENLTGQDYAAFVLGDVRGDLDFQQGSSESNRADRLAPK
jgi:hypothetical protein